MTMTTTDLIVDFPKEGRRNREYSHLRTVQFSEKLDVHIVERHEDGHKIPRHELWYTKPEYNSMKRTIQEDRLEVLRTAQGGSFDYAGGNSSEREVCCIGIEHLLTRESMLHVRDCRVRCTYAVLAEQARQGSDLLSVALASIGQTRVTARRAVALAKLHKGAAEKA
jgi:hypothetical protein